MGVGAGPVDHEVVRLLPVALVVAVVARVLDGVLDCTPGGRRAGCGGGPGPPCMHVPSRDRHPRAGLLLQELGLLCTQAAVPQEEGGGVSTETVPCMRSAMWQGATVELHGLQQGGYAGGLSGRSLRRTHA